MSWLRAFQSCDSQVTTASELDQYQRPNQGNTSGSGAWNAPLARTENSSETYGFDKKTSKECYIRLSKEAARVSVGPMPVRDFLRTFLPISDEILGEMPPCTDAFNRCAESKSEADLYKPLLKALNRDPSHHDARCPGFQFRNTSNRPDTSSGPVGSAKPDIVCYAQEHISIVEVHGKELDAYTNMGFATTFIEVKFPASLDCWCDPDESKDRNAWSLAFGDLSSLDSAHETAEETLGQNAAYAIEIFARQHRSFLFSVFVFGEYARLIRWDRAGLIVSERFDYVLRPQLLCEFFWRFAHLSDAQRGLDLSVRPATLDEETFFKRAVEQHNMTQVGHLNMQSNDLDALLQTHYMANGVSAIHLPSQGDGDPARDLLISRPLTIPLSLTGRATRAYWAVEYDADATQPPPMVVLKDTWRLHEGFSETEGSILRQLAKAEVPNIPSVICDHDVCRESSKQRRVVRPSTPDLDGVEDGAWVGFGEADLDIADGQLASSHEPATSMFFSGDNAEISVNGELEATNRDTTSKVNAEESSECVPKDKTLTQFYLRTQFDWVCNRSVLKQWVIPRRHYRLVTNVAGYTLLHLSGTYELLHGAHDAFQALTGAAHASSRLHRDVHPGNIILFKDPESERRKGYLIDWDVSCVIGSNLHLNGNYLPSLQWQFLAVDLLTKSETPEAIQHTLEHDMESMFWVVLYCGLLRLQHTEGRGDSLTEIIRLLFDDVKFYKSRPQGGDGKLLDMTKRVYTRQVVWDCPDLRDWIQVVYNSLSSALNKHLRFDLCFAWTAERFGAFWKDFLESRHLSLDNRHDNVQLEVDSKLMQYWASSTVQGNSHQATTTAGSKRTAEEQPPGPARPYKQPRLHLRRDTYEHLSIQGSNATVPPDTPFHSSISVVAPSATMLSMSKYSFATAMPIAGPSSGGEATTASEWPVLPGTGPSQFKRKLIDDDEGSQSNVGGPKAKKSRRLYISKGNYSARMMCKRWVKEQWPDTTEDEFKIYWSRVTQEDIERWSDRGIDARRRACEEQGAWA